MDTNKKFIIIHNLDDHQGYKGEEVIVVTEHGENYFTVQSTKNNLQWRGGEEELQEV